MSDLSRRIAGLVLLLVAVALPLVLEDFWLQLGLFVMARMVGAVGLTLLVGVAGQLSLGHAAFAAIGAYVYVWATSESTPTLAGPACPRWSASCSRSRWRRSWASSSRRSPAGCAASTSAWPPSAWSSSVRHLLLNLDDWTGGFTGRSVEPFSRSAVQLQQPRPRLPRRRRRGGRGAAPALVPVPRPHPPGLLAGGEPARSRTGRAWANLRDSETAAAAMGIAVARHKASAFVVSSATPGWRGHCSRSPTAASRPTSSASPCPSTSW